MDNTHYREYFHDRLSTEVNDGLALAISSLDRAATETNACLAAHPDPPLPGVQLSEEKDRLFVLSIYLGSLIWATSIRSIWRKGGAQLLG